MSHSPVTDERLAELTDKLENGIKELYASGRYAEYLAAMSKFHQYSFGNALLILLQCPAASQVAGYGAWKKLGSHVKQYESGIKILATCPYRKRVEQERKDPATGQILCGPDGQPLRETCYVSATYFKVVTVFDISQTEGRELPRIGVSELVGEVADFPMFYVRLAELSPLPVEQGPVPGTAKGYTSFIEGRIVLRPGMSQAQTIKTLVHEIAHAMLHDPSQVSDGEPRQRREKEVEAESVAYVVCQHFGLDTADYSFGYVAGWSRGRELAELKASLDRIHSAAGEIINTIQPPEKQITQEYDPQEQARRHSRRHTGKRKK